MAGRCLASFPTIRQKNLREEVIERILDLFLETSYSRLRDQIVDVLVLIGGDAITSRLVTLVKDVQISLSVRSGIARALGELGELEEGLVAQDLMGMLKNSQVDDEVRSDIAVALETLGERSVIPDYESQGGGDDCCAG